MKPLCLLLLALLLLGCADDETVGVGVVTILSGTDAHVGQWTMRGLEVAADEINAQGGINGKRIKLIYEDSENSAEQALIGARKLVEIDGVSALITLSGASATLSILPYANERGIVQMEVVCVIPSCHTLNDSLFRASGPPEAQAEYLAGYLHEQRIGKVAIIWVNNDFGANQKNAFEERYGGEIAEQEWYELGTTDFRTVISKVAAGNPEAVLLFTYPSEPGHILKQARELGISTPMIGLFTSQNPEILRIAGEAAQGYRYAYFTTDSSTEKAKAFTQAYRERYGEDPEVFATKSYDALSLLGIAMRNCPDPANAECVKEGLYGIRGYEGASNTITIDEYGDLASERFTMKKVRDGQFVKE